MGRIAVRTVLATAALAVVVLSAQVCAQPAPSGIGSLPLTGSIRPSFDCARATGSDERTICRVPRLAEIDLELNEAYGRARTVVADPTRLAAEEQSWLATRQQCGGRADCIESRMLVRLSQLRALAAALVPAAPPVPAVAASTPPASPTQAAEIAYADRLARPPVGLQVLPLSTVDGVPVVAGSDQPGEKAFNLLLGLSFRPGMLEQGGSGGGATGQFARTFLPRGSALLGPNGDWSGADEFQRRDNRARFLTEYGDALRSMAITAPFRFAMISGPFALPEYDAGARGFALPDLGRPSLPVQAGDDAVHLRGADPAPRFLPLDEAAARQLVQTLAVRSPRDRRVRMVMELEAGSLDLPNLLVNVRRVRLTLYDPSLTSVLHEFPDSIGTVHNTLAQLARPPGMVRAFNLPSLGGTPLLPAYADWKHDLFLLLGLGAADDHAWEQAHGVEIARRLLSDQARTETINFADWAGQDEFARSRSRDEFFERELPAIKAAAPRLPLVFAYAQPSSLGEYDAMRHGFPLGSGKSVTLDIDQDVAGGGLRAALPFAWPDGFWPLEPAAAQQMLRALQPADASSTAPVRSRAARYVTVVGVLEAGPVDPSTRTLTLRLRSMAIYTPDLKTRLYDLPVQLDRAPGLRDPSARLHFAAAAEADGFFLCAKLFQADSGHPPPAVAARCLDSVRQRDTATYARPEMLSALEPGDARWPFFPRNATPDDAAATETFGHYMLAYATAVDESQVLFNATGGQQTGGDLSVPAFASPVSSGGDTLARAAGAAQGDQLVSFGTIYDRTVYGVLPNRASLYAVTVPGVALSGPSGTTKVEITAARVGPARSVPGEGAGRPSLVVMDVTPLSGSVTAGGRVLATRAFDDIPRLDAATFSRPAPRMAVAVPSSPLLLDGGLADLLAASAVGDRLSPEAITAMVLRRWAYENERTPVIGDGRGGGTPYASPGAATWPARFFVAGKRRPTPEEALGLRIAFLDWARAAVPPLPVTVATPGRVELRRNLSAAPWYMMACFSGGAMASPGFGPRAGGLDIGECERRGHGGSPGQPGLLPSEQRTCFALEAAAATAGDVATLGALCRPALSGLGFTDPAIISLLIPHDLTAPPWHFLGDQHTLLADATLRITAIILADRAPQGSDLLPEALRLPSPVPPGGTSTGRPEYIVFRTEFGNVLWREPDGTEVARVTAEQGSPVAAVLARYQAEITAMPAGPSGPELDVLGIKLGMSFDEAERLVRAGMPVGRVLIGRRPSEPAAKNGDITPLTSGRLFIRADGQEMIGLFDEPPATPGRVMAVWRRLLVPPEVASAEALQRNLVEKYGPLPPNVINAVGSDLHWVATRAGACLDLTRAQERRPLMSAWTDDGQGEPAMPNVGMMPGVRAPLQGPRWPSVLLRIDADWPPPANKQAQEQAVAECGAAVNAIVADTRMTGSPSNYVDVTLIDAGAYLAAFHKNRDMLRPPPGNSAGPIKF